MDINPSSDILHGFHPATGDPACLQIMHQRGTMQITYYPGLMAFLLELYQGSLTCFF